MPGGRGRLQSAWGAIAEQLTRFRVAEVHSLSKSPCGKGEASPFRLAGKD